LKLIAIAAYPLQVALPVVKQAACHRKKKPIIKGFGKVRLCFQRQGTAASGNAVPLFVQRGGKERQAAAQIQIAW
jgi:hypothetical protein